MVLMLDSIYSVMVTLIGIPSNDAEHFLVYLTCVLIGLYMFMVSLSLFLYPYKMLFNRK